MSRLPFELLLALRYLRPKRTFVSVITLISVIGVALGVAVLFIVISVMSGFDKQMRESVLGANAHIEVQQTNSTMTNYLTVLNLVTSNRNVRAVAPFVQGQVPLRTQPEQGQSMFVAPLMRGVDPQLEPRVSTLASNVIRGEFDLSGRGVVVGKAFAENLKLGIGDRVNIYSLKDLQELDKNRGKEGAKVRLPDEYEVRGIFDTGFYEFNANLILVSLENGQELYDLGDSVHGLRVMLRDPFIAPAVAEQLEHALGPNYTATTWLQQSSLLSAVLVEKNVMFYILFFIVIVAAFGITCTLITFVVMKTREIGVLKALGASNRQVMWVFLMQSIVVSLMGIIAGLTGGGVALYYRNEFLDFMRRTTGMQLFPEDIYGFSHLPALFVPRDIVIIAGGSLLICLLAAAFPARYASRMDPVEALRYE